MSCEHVEVGVGWGHNRCPLCLPIGGPAPLLQVLFGTADGQVIVMDCHGRMLAHVLLHESDGILSMSWNYPAFLVEDSSESDTDSDDYSPPQGGPAGRAGRRRIPSRQAGFSAECRAELARPVSDLDGTVTCLFAIPLRRMTGRVAWPSTGFPRRRTRLMAISVTLGCWGEGGAWCLGRNRTEGENCCAVPTA